jgi:hypothetical protein
MGEVSSVAENCAYKGGAQKALDPAGSRQHTPRTNIYETASSS